MTRGLRITRTLLLACVALLGVSCNWFGPCTLIGCGDSLNVTLQPAVGLPYQATLSFPQGETVTFRCTSMSFRDVVPEGLVSVQCSRDSLTIMCDSTPDYCSTSPVTISVVGPDGHERSGVVTPSYSVSQPNGPRCGPTCKSGKTSLPGG